MARLNQVIAIEKTRKAVFETAITKAYQTAQKTDQFSGQRRVYTPVDAEGETKPDEIQNVIATVAGVIEDFSEALASLSDATAIKVDANTRARADVVVAGVTLVPQAPVELLLFLEKRLTDVLQFIGKLPVLDPSITWGVDVNTGLFASAEQISNSTTKVLKNHVKAPATDKHPAQVDTYTADEVVGHWAKVQWSGAVPITQIVAWRNKALEVLDAVKFAREQANSIDVVDQAIGADVLNYIFS